MLAEIEYYFACARTPHLDRAVEGRRAEQQRLLAVRGVRSGGRPFQIENLFRMSLQIKLQPRFCSEKKSKIEVAKEGHSYHSMIELRSYDLVSRSWQLYHRNSSQEGRRQDSS